MSKITKGAFWALLGLILFSAACTPRDRSSSNANEPAAKDSAAFDFKLPLYKDSARTLTLSDILSHQAVLLVFWATWCPSCQEESAVLNEWQDKEFLENTRILAVNVRETEADIRKFEEKHPLHYTVLLDAQAEVSSRLQVEELPTVILLAKGGKILYYGFRLPKDIQTYLVEGERSNGFSRPGF